MQGRNVWVLLAAIAIGIVAVVLANAWFSGMEKRQVQAVEEQKLVSIVVATQPMEFGTKITPQMLRLQGWPSNSVPEGAFTAIAEVLKDNRVALRPMVINEPVLASKVSGTDGRATLAAVLPKGMAAFSIPVDAVNGVAGFVLPGTMVDIMLTRQIEGPGASGTDLRSDVILRNVQVLAVDQFSSDKEGDPKVSRTATMAVTLFDAQRLAIAQKLGTLSLALRKVEDGASQPGATAIVDATSTVTSRQIARPMYVGVRPVPGPAMQRAAAYRIPAIVRAPRSISAGPVSTGSTMTVIRGTEPTTYSLTRQ